jgi:hypothetical protein
MYGVAYARQAAMWKMDGPRGPEIIFSYSINKEDIGLSRFPLSVL